jgi:hypothetical protein
VAFLHRRWLNCPLKSRKKNPNPQAADLAQDPRLHLELSLAVDLFFSSLFSSRPQLFFLPHLSFNRAYELTRILSF